MPCTCPDCVAAREAGDEALESAACEDCGHDPCECPMCSYCGAVSHDLCSDCGRCPNCCQCSSPYCDGDHSRFSGDPTPRYPRYLGVEIECVLARVTGREYRAIARKWGSTITSDGSIHTEGNGTGIEHDTSPARGGAFLSQIDETIAILHAQGAQVNKSCGLHVHVDARDYTTRDVLALARIYSRVEKTLYAMVAKPRRTNTFCEPWGEEAFVQAVRTTEGMVSALDEAAPLTAREKALDVATYGSEDLGRRCKVNRYKDGSRYHGLNFNALACHSTIEFRLHHGTVNATKIKMWAAVCSALVEYAKTHSEAEITALRGTPAEILDKVISDPEVSRWCRKRRAHFETLDRERRGLAPRARPVVPEAAPVPEIPDMPTEPGEGGAGDRGRVGRRQYR